MIKVPPIAFRHATLTFEVWPWLLTLIILQSHKIYGHGPHNMQKVEFKGHSVQS